MFGSGPKIQKPPTPAATPTKADASVLAAGLRESAFPSLINTGATGLKRKAAIAKTSLLGGSA